MRFPKVNLHTHTTYCDGKESVESMIQAAIAKDFVRLGFSGHVFNDFRPEDQDIWCMSPERTQKYIEEVRMMAEKYKDNIDEDIFDTIRDDFLGAYRSAENPEVVERGQCKNTMASGWSPWM